MKQALNLCSVGPIWRVPQPHTVAPEHRVMPVARMWSGPGWGRSQHHAAAASAAALAPCERRPMRKRCAPQPANLQSGCPRSTAHGRSRLFPGTRCCHVSHASTSAGTSSSCFSAAPCKEARTADQHLHHRR
eukprot:5783025-Prymnesium_polylepis.1